MSMKCGLMKARSVFFHRQCAFDALYALLCSVHGTFLTIVWKKFCVQCSQRSVGLLCTALLFMCEEDTLFHPPRTRYVQVRGGSH